jgi:hypothetical protein
MSRKSDLGLLIAVTVLVIASAVLVGLGPANPPVSGPRFMVVFDAGSLYINDAGMSHGGFEYAAEYSVTVSQGCNGTVEEGHIAALDLALVRGLGDALQVHHLELLLGSSTNVNEILLSGGGVEIRLVRQVEDLVWNHSWDGYYVASWGAYAPQGEIRGTISPGIFGLPDHYYVELRLSATFMPMPVP